MTETPVHKTSPQALEQRRGLLDLLKVTAALVLLLALLASDPSNLALWAALAVAWFLLWRLNFVHWLDTYASRELRMLPQLIEEHRQGFTRLILFEQIEQLRVRQGKNEKIQAIEVRTLQGAFLLRGYENMESLFASLSQRRPANVIIEIEEGGSDWQSPKPWGILVFCVGALALALIWVFR